MRALRLRGAGEVQAVMAYYLCAAAAQQLLLRSRLSAIGGFLLRALELLIVLASRRAETEERVS